MSTGFPSIRLMCHLSGEGSCYTSSRFGLLSSRRFKFAIAKKFPGLRRLAGRYGVRGLLASILARSAPWVYSLCYRGVPRSVQSEYCAWLLRRYPRPEDLERMRAQAADWDVRPLISIIMPVYNSRSEHLAAAIESVRAQVYQNWELCIVDDASSNPETLAELNSCERAESRIRVLRHERNGGISAASNSALGMAQGPYVAQLDHDDVLTPHALWRIVQCINEHPGVDIVYSDEDKIEENGLLRDPFFKQDWSPDSFLSKMYTCHFGVYRRELVEEIGGFRSEFDGAEDYDLVLRLSEIAEEIMHIPDVLYHWRVHEGSAAFGPTAKKTETLRNAGRCAVQSALIRRGESAVVDDVPNLACHYQVRYLLDKPVKVAVVVLIEGKRPVSERFSALAGIGRALEDERGESSCMRLVGMNVGGGNVESREVLVEAGIPEIGELALEDEQYLVFLSEYCSWFSPGWCYAMLEQAQRESIGAVGALTVGPDNRVIHAGMILGPRRGLAGSHENAPACAPGYFGQLQTITNYSALGHGCLACRAALINEVDGIDRELPAELCIPDLCLKLSQRGYRNVYLPHAKVVLSRRQGECNCRNSDFQRFCDRWEKVIANDPFYNPNLSLRNGDFRLRVNDR